MLKSTVHGSERVSRGGRRRARHAHRPVGGGTRPRHADGLDRGAAAFKNGDIYVEKYDENPRHIEVLDVIYKPRNAHKLRGLGIASSPQIITSAIVGTFYRAPSPQAEPFVKVGSKVESDTVVCIIEAMKLMNEIQAETAAKSTSRTASRSSTASRRSGSEIVKAWLQRLAVF